MYPFERLLNVRQKIFRLQYFLKYLGTLFSMQSNLTSFCFDVNYNFIIVMPE